MSRSEAIFNEESSENTLFENQFKPEKKEMLEYCNRIIYRSIWVYHYLFCIAFSSFMIWLEIHFLGILVFNAAVFAIAHIRNHITVKKMMKRHELQASSEQNIKFFEDNFKISTGVLFQYSQISNIVIGKLCIYIIIEKSLNIMVKKDAFNKGDCDSFLAFLREKQKDNKKIQARMRRKNIPLFAFFIPIAIVVAFFLSIAINANSVTIGNQTIRTNARVLNLSDGQIDDLTQLKALNNLRMLDLSNNQITDITPLESLTNLTMLILRDNYIDDLTPLGHLYNLTDLELSNNQFDDISPLKSLSNLTALGLHHNQIDDLSPLQSLYNLTALNLSYSQIDDVLPLQGLSNLENLHLYFNKISDISALRSLSNLTVLALHQNQINDLTPLQSLYNLTALNLSYNQVDDISALQSLSNLTVLALYHNQINDITPLKGLTELTRLDLANNEISDISPLIEFESLAEVWLSNNQLTVAQVDELKVILPNLIIHY